MAQDIDTAKALADWANRSYVDFREMYPTLCPLTGAGAQFDSAWVLQSLAYIEARKAYLARRPDAHPHSKVE